MTSTIRIGRILNPTDLRCVLADCSDGSILQKIITADIGIVKRLDGLIVADAESIIKNRHVFLGRRSPSYILRVGSEVLQASNPKAKVEELIVEALRMDFSAVISTFTIGHEDERIDSNSMKLIAMLSDVCYDYELPFIVEAAPFGERVSSENYSESVGLAARMAVEVGASIVAIPPLKKIEDLKNVVESVKTYTLLIDPSSKLVIEKMQQNLPDILLNALNIGLNGIVLSGSLNIGNLVNLLTDMLSLVHGRA
jgi:DhnA family fructose-bisphosphate aldolase class Ia